MSGIGYHLHFVLYLSTYRPRQIRLVCTHSLSLFLLFPKVFLNLFWYSSIEVILSLLRDCGWVITSTAYLAHSGKPCSHGCVFQSPRECGLIRYRVKYRRSYLEKYISFMGLDIQSRNFQQWSDCISLRNRLDPRAFPSPIVLVDLISGPLRDQRMAIPFFTKSTNASRKHCTKT